MSTSARSPALGLPMAIGTSSRSPISRRDGWSTFDTPITVLRASDGSEARAARAVLPSPPPNERLSPVDFPTTTSTRRRQSSVFGHRSRTSKRQSATIHPRRSPPCAPNRRSRLDDPAASVDLRKAQRPEPSCRPRRRTENRGAPSAEARHREDARRARARVTNEADAGAHRDPRDAS